jgi:hypothetical protein
MPDPELSKIKLTFDIEASLLNAAQMKAVQNRTTLEQVIGEELTADLREALPIMNPPITKRFASGKSVLKAGGQ